MLFIVMLLLSNTWDADAAIFPSVPNHLLTCYRSDGPASTAPYRLDVLLSTLRTLERNTQLNLRLFTISLLRSFRLDGIERGSNAVESEFVTPYHASGFQFHKYKLLMDIFLSSQDLNLLNDTVRALTVGERCILHKMISSTVNSQERGDENRVCPDIAVEGISFGGVNLTRGYSRCPIELGVIQTEWGTIAPGTIIAAVATTMESQRVLVKDIFNANQNKLSEPLESDININELNVDTPIDTDGAKETPRMENADISNVWVATLAGDLAEVAVNQGPRVGFRAHKVILGGSSRWNDTLLPRHHYMLNHPNGSVNWHFTDAEILAGIDGLILSHHIPKWIQERETLRVSQIMEMYYSNEGMSFDPTIKACNRLSMFPKIFDVTDLITEVSNFAQVLSLAQGSVFIPIAEMDNICKSVVDAFLEYYPTLLARYDSGCRVVEDVPSMDLIIATDGSWKGYDVEQFSSWLGDASDVGLSGSSLGLMHSNTASWIAPPSANLTAFYEHVRNHTGDWPNRLNFPDILSFLMRHLQNKTLMEAENEASVSRSTVVLVVSPSDRLSDTEAERAQDLMRTLRTTYFDVYFDYVAQDLTSFKNINSGDYDYSENFLQVPSNSVQDVIEAVNQQIISNQVAKSIIGAHCSFNGTTFTQLPYEDFVEPSRSKQYRIHPYYLKEQPLIHVQIRNSGQGSLRICSWRGAEKATNCHVVEARDRVLVNFTNPCTSPEFCPPAHIKVSGISSNIECANNDCRFPHSIGYYIQHTGLRCLQLRGDSSHMKPILKIYFVVLIITTSL